MRDALNFENLKEELAALEHERWAHWQKYLHGKCAANADGSLTIPKQQVDKWERQINTPYAELEEAEKDSDRSQVEKYFPILEAFIIKSQPS